MASINKRLRSAITLAAIASCLAGCATTRESSIGLFLGSWVIDIDRSMEFARAESAHTEKSDDDLWLFFHSQMSAMRIDVTTEDVIFFVQDRGVPYPYTTVTSGAQDITLAMEFLGEPHTIKFTKRGDRINMKATVQPDFDYCIWQRPEASPSGNPVKISSDQQSLK